MKRFENLEDLAWFMIDKTDSEESASAVVDAGMAVDLMKVFFDIDDSIRVMLMQIDNLDYDKEYLVTIYYYKEECCYELYIEKAFNESCGKYISTDGYVCFHEDVSHKALSDMFGNEYGDIHGYDWFIVGEDDSFEKNDEDYKPFKKPKESSPSKVKDKKDEESKTQKKESKGFKIDKEYDDGDYHVKVKCDLDTDEALKVIDELEKKIARINDAFGEMDHFRKLFNW